MYSFMQVIICIHKIAEVYKIMNGLNFLISASEGCTRKWQKVQLLCPEITDDSSSDCHCYFDYGLCLLTFLLCLHVFRFVLFHAEFTVLFLNLYSKQDKDRKIRQRQPAPVVFHLCLINLASLVYTSLCASLCQLVTFHLLSFFHTSIAFEFLLFPRVCFFLQFSPFLQSF